ncbi:hypothetical protein HY572_00010 [Candidatus Micrarchaeota archaeon]|nr:hypothetical protein [Candidatus Micrarchaeota archaeon]
MCAFHVECVAAGANLHLVARCHGAVFDESATRERIEGLGHSLRRLDQEFEEHIGSLPPADCNAVYQMLRIFKERARHLKPLYRNAYINDVALFFQGKRKTIRNLLGDLHGTLESMDRVASHRAAQKRFRNARALADHLNAVLSGHRARKQAFIDVPAQLAALRDLKFDARALESPAPTSPELRLGTHVERFERVTHAPLKASFTHQRDGADFIFQLDLGPLQERIDRHAAHHLASALADHLNSLGFAHPL